LLRVVAGAFAVYTLVIAVLLVCEDRIVYHPVSASRRWSEPPDGYPAHDVELLSADGTSIHGRWFPSSKATGAVLICHSQTGNASMECGPSQLAGWQQTVGVSVFVTDYPGYGRCGGTPSEAGCYAAAEAAYTWLTHTQLVPPNEVLLFGRSLGTGVAVDLASRHGHRALLLVSPYTSLPDVALRRFGLLPAPLLMRNRFPSRAKIGGCTRPLFVLHGTDDHQVPFTLGKQLFDAANEPKRFMAVQGGHHGGGLMACFFPAVRDFLNDVESTASPTAP
jgi:pimeloyl-ACP methyl ester carboxylesterase